MASAGRQALRRKSRDYDDNQQREGQSLAEVLPGQGLPPSWVDIEDTEESDVAERFEPAGVDFVNEDITERVIPQRADEFTCSNCFLIHHVSRLTSVNGGRALCTDCV